MVQSTIDQISNSGNLWTIISGIIGILAFVISAINLIHYFVSRRMNVSIKIDKITTRPSRTGGDFLILHCQINNRSHLPISVTDLQLISNDKKYSVYYSENEIMIPVPLRDPIIYPLIHTPINLPMLSSRAGYIAYDNPKGIAQELREEVTLEIRTNRLDKKLCTLKPNELLILRGTFRVKEIRSG